MCHLFLFDHYYPCGGMNDHAGEFSSPEEALDYAKKSESDYYQVVTSNFSVYTSGRVEDL